MAFSVGGSNGLSGGRRRFGAGNGTMSEMNVVPLVDVVLVLLVIFMLTAQAMEFGLEVNVPETKTSTTTTEDLPVVQLSREGKMMLNDKPIENINLIGEQIKQRFPQAKAVYIRADKAVTWEALAHIVAAVGAAKYDVKLVTRPADNRR